MDLERLRDAFLRHGHRLEQHTDLFEPPRHLDDEVFVLDVILSEIAVAQIDAALEVLRVGRHVLETDGVIDARARAPHGGDHVVAWRDRGDVRADGFDAAEAFVADDQEIVTGRRRTVLGRIDLAVGAVDADAQHLDEDASSVREFTEGWPGDFGEMGALRAARQNGDSFHGPSMPRAGCRFGGSMRTIQRNSHWLTTSKRRNRNGWLGRRAPAIPGSGEASS